MRLENKVALITGGGTGIGAATARLFAREGAKIVVTGRRREPIEEIAAEVGGGSVTGDTSDPAHAAEAVAHAVSAFGGLDIAVDYGARGIRANALCPGWVITPMGDGSMDWLAEAKGLDRQGAYDLATADVPSRRPGTAEEMANCCLFLASDESSIVSGTTLVA